ncbi:short-chain alcohol dehydrogenase [Pestalotiopsis sp. IQ-011]
MAVQQDGFKVIIAGGGVAGLPLANMLEKFDIDYVLLESHGDITPTYWDQIGCYKSILELPQQPLQLSHSRDVTGKSQFLLKGTASALEESFGIAQHVPNYIAGEQNTTKADGYSTLTISGPEDRVYWFVFQRLPKRLFGKDIPKYSKEDEALFVKENGHIAVTDKVTFGQIYAKRLYTKLDMRSQGGNNAIESAASLVNPILDLRDEREGSLQGITEEELERVFQQIQSARHHRVTEIVAKAHQQQSLAARENPLQSEIFNLIGPLKGEEFFFDLFSAVNIDAVSLNRLPMPHRPRQIPFNDELPAHPAQPATAKVVNGVSQVLWSGYFVRQTRCFSCPSEMVGWGAPHAHFQRPWARNHSKNVLVKLVSIFSYPLLDKNPATTAQLAYFMSQQVTCPNH